MARRDCTDEEHDRAQRIRDIVVPWAREHARDDLNYGSPQSYYAAAHARNIISDEEYNLMSRWYGDMFHYRGD